MVAAAGVGGGPGGGGGGGGAGMPSPGAPPLELRIQSQGKGVCEGDDDVTMGKHPNICVQSHFPILCLSFPLGNHLCQVFLL